MNLPLTNADRSRDRRACAVPPWRYARGLGRRQQRSSVQPSSLGAGTGEGRVRALGLNPALWITLSKVWMVSLTKG